MTPNEQKAYDAGRDCALHGANTNNCSFRHFATPNQTAAWEHGKDAGNKERKTGVGDGKQN